MCHQNHRKNQIMYLFSNIVEITPIIFIITSICKSFIVNFVVTLIFSLKPFF